MVRQKRSSFIPKNPAPATASQKPRGIRNVYIFTYFIYIFFFGTLLTAGGTMFYIITLHSKLENEKQTLHKEQSSFNQAGLDHIRDLDSRLYTSFMLLHNQVAVSNIFSVLEKTTLRSIQITGFEYIKDEKDNLNLSFLARAHEFNEALYQREIYLEDSVLSGSTVSKITYTGSKNRGANRYQNTELLFTVDKVLSHGDIAFQSDNVLQAPENSVEMIQTHTIDTVSEILTTSTTSTTSENTDAIINPLGT